MELEYYMRADDGTITSTTDLKIYAAWSQKHGQGVSVQLADDMVGNARVSTIFLSIDHGLMHDKPVLFETMVFVDGDMSGEFQYRYCTEKEALAGHALALQKLREALNTNKLLK